MVFSRILINFLVLLTAVGVGYYFGYDMYLRALDHGHSEAVSRSDGFECGVFFVIVGLIFVFSIEGIAWIYRREFKKPRGRTKDLP